MQVHKDLAQQMRMRHHSLAAELEYKHLNTHQNLRRQHLESQQQTEWTNQMDYNRNRERDLRKKHLVEVRKQPKDLKVSNYFLKIVAFTKAVNGSYMCTKLVQ